MTLGADVISWRWRAWNQSASLDDDVTRRIVFKILRARQPQHPRGFGGLQVRVEIMREPTRQRRCQRAVRLILQVERLLQHPVTSV